MIAAALTIGCLSLLLSCPTLAAERRFAQLTGWGGGKPEELVPQAADVGFDEIIVGSHDAAYLTRMVALGQQRQVGIYSCIHLSDIKGWSHRYPDIAPPLQVLNETEQAALDRIHADKSMGKSGYQYGGEPVHALEVLETPLLCFHHTEVREFFQEQIRALLRVSGLRGIAMDFFGYQNYRCCRCQKSMAAMAAWRKRHTQLSAEVASERFALESLVDFINALAHSARACRGDAKVSCHVYPVFVPEPLYGNRLDVDFCGQTAAWYFEPLWAYEKIRSYTRVICGAEKKYFTRPEGVAMIGVYTRPKLFPVKSPARLRGELQAILDGAGDRVQVCSLNDVLADPATRQVFEEFFRRGSPVKAPAKARSAKDN